MSITKQFTINEVNYQSSTLTLVGENNERCIVAADISESWIKFVCSTLFKVALRKANARFLEGVDIVCTCDPDDNVTFIKSLRPRNLEDYANSMTSIFYIHDLVKMRQQGSRRPMQTALDLLVDDNNLKLAAFANPYTLSKGTSDTILNAVCAYQELLRKLYWGLSFGPSICMVASHASGASIDKKERNAIARYFTGYTKQYSLKKSLEERVEWEAFVKLPYALRKAEGVSFSTLDRIAVHRCTSYDMRLRYNILNEIQLIMEDEGHMYASTKSIKSGLKRALIDDIRITSEERIKQEIVKRDVDNNTPLFTYVSDYEVYDATVYSIQEELIEKLNTLNQRVDPEIDGWEECTKKKGLHAHQEEIVRAFAHGACLLLLTGGPGTGKTRVIETVNEVATIGGLKVALCAPTGKAAKRLGPHGKTIHRLVYSKDNFSNDYLPYDVIVVDESSMLDIAVMHMLMTRIDVSITRLIFVGDPRQLPPIGYGRPFKDMIDCNTIKLVHLTRTFRQDGDSPIVTLAKEVEHGRMPDNAMLNNDVVSLLPIKTRDEQGRAINFITKELKKFYANNSSEDQINKVQVLCCCNEKGMFSNKSVNEYIHNAIYKDNRLDKHCTPSIGEKVLVTKNNYVRSKKSGEIDVNASSFNGDIGVYVGIGNDFARMIEMYGEQNKAHTVDVPPENAVLGHAITIHKSQGSEYNTVYLMIDEAAGPMLVRELLYTGITRAKERLYIFANTDILERCISSISRERNSKIPAGLRPRASL